MNRIRLLKVLDRFIGKAACAIIRPPRQAAHDLSFSKRILVIRPGGIGDAALLIPAIQALRKAYPSSCIDVLAEKRNSSVFSLSAGIDKVFCYDTLQGCVTMLRGEYDIIIDTEQWHRLSVVLARLVGAPVIIGYATNERTKLLTHSVRYDHDEYEIESFLHLLAPLNIAVFERPKIFLNVPLEVKNRVKRCLAPLSGKKFVAMFPGSSILERKWGATKFHALATMLVRDGYGIVVVGGREDSREGSLIMSGLAGALDLSGLLTLPETAAVLESSVLLITGDTGIMHIGHGLGLKTVAIFGPGRQKKWAPLRDSITVSKKMSCSPCTTFGYTAHCDKNAVCMSSISVEEVYEAAMRLLRNDMSTWSR